MQFLLQVLFAAVLGSTITNCQGLYDQVRKGAGNYGNAEEGLKQFNGWTNDDFWNLLKNNGPQAFKRRFQSQNGGEGSDEGRPWGQEGNNGHMSEKGSGPAIGEEYRSKGSERRPWQHEGNNGPMTGQGSGPANGEGFNSDQGSPSGGNFQRYFDAQAFRRRFGPPPQRLGMENGDFGQQGGNGNNQQPEQMAGQSGQNEEPSNFEQPQRQPSQSSQSDHNQQGNGVGEDQQGVGPHGQGQNQADGGDGPNGQGAGPSGGELPPETLNILRELVALFKKERE